jgi:hypothetical protein
MEVEMTNRRNLGIRRCLSQGSFKAGSFLLPLILFLFSASFLHAQGGATGTILGTVTDNSGAVVPNASVDAINAGTNVTSHTQTTGSGNYTVPYLNPGVYRVSVQAPGFQKMVVDNVTLVVDQQVRIDVTLKPGIVTQTVEVRANAVALDTDNAAISQTVSDKQVEELPINGRNFTSLLFISPGAVTLGGEMGGMRSGEGGDISVNGGRPESNEYTLDGLSITDNAMTTPSIILSIDAIQEFKIQSDSYSAEYGFSADQVNLISKSGTNGIHGTLFEFDRNNFFDSTYPLTGKVPTLHQNQFGFVVGGPVYLGKLYDGRNKTFFMANFEGTRIISEFQLFAEVPTPADLSGNFSADNLPEPGTAACNAALALNNPCMPENPATGLAFPNNTIPSSLFSRQATVDLAANTFPAPNCNPALCAGDNENIQSPLPNTANQQTYRLDQDLGRFGKIFGRGTYAAYTNTNLRGGYSIPYGDSNFVEDEKNWAISHTISFGSKVNNFRFGYLSAIANVVAPSPSAAQIAALGYSGVFTKFAPGQASWSWLSFPGTQYTQMGGPNSAVTASYQPSWEFADSFTMVHGRHTLSFGGDFRHWHIDRDLDNDFFGDYSFTNNTLLTNGVGCATVVCGTGNVISDYLLGYYSNVGAYIPGPLSPTNEAGNPQYHVYNYLGLYAQDDWKVSPRLTVNAGLRWDFKTVPYEESNKFFWWDQSNARGGLCFADPALLTDGVAPPGNGYYEYCGRRSPAMPGQYKPFAPRLGFAYRPVGEKTVIRSAYGIYYDSFEDREIDDAGDVYPFSVRDSLTPTTQPVTTAPKNVNQLFPSFTKLNEIGPAEMTFFGVIESPRPLNPYVQQWTLSVERQLARNTTLEVNYVGTKGTKLLDRHLISQAYTPTDPAVCQANPANCPVSARLPYPNFSGLFINADFMGNSDYNAGNIKLERRNSSMALVAIFTWAKSLDEKSGAAGVGGENGPSAGGYGGFTNNHDGHFDYGPSDFDVDHRFVASYVYNLPFGRGKHFLSNMNKAENAVLGGWEFTGITTFQTGFPYSCIATDLDSILATPEQRCNKVGQVYPSGFHKTPQEYINTAAFAQPPIAVYGDAGRNFLRSPGINNFDLGLFKNFAFTERTNLQLRLETFNSFNHHQYYAPISGATVGGVCEPDCVLSDSTFGAITASAQGRVVQLGVKLNF